MPNPVLTPEGVAADGLDAAFNEHVQNIDLDLSGQAVRSMYDGIGVALGGNAGAVKERRMQHSCDGCGIKTGKNKCTQCLSAYYCRSVSCPCVRIRLCGLLMTRRPLGSCIACLVCSHYGRGREAIAQDSRTSRTDLTRPAHSALSARPA